MRFDLHVGIDYSGAETADSRLPGLQVWSAEDDCCRPAGHQRWSRRELADWIVTLGRQEQRFIVGIDHAFSFPVAYLDRYELTSWDGFLGDFVAHWPATDTGATVERLRRGNPRTGTPDEMRLTDAWTSSAKSVFRFNVQGQVAKSSHAGIPLLAKIRRELGRRVHFWPFDGWDPPEGSSVIAEVYPSILSKRFPRPADRTTDAHDAFAVATWLRDCDQRGVLDHYLHPPLTDDEQRLARREGWILGIC